ncbi:hypothetical protein Ancab_023055 [Ancistrocladus abbreviatus]
MADPYWRYGSVTGTGSVPRSGHPGLLPSEPSSVAPPHLFHSNEVLGLSTDHLERDVPPARPGTSSLDNNFGIGARGGPSLSAPTTGIGARIYPPPMADSNLIIQRRDIPMGMNPHIPDVPYEIGIQAEPGLGTPTTIINTRSYPSALENPDLIRQRRDIPVGLSPHIPDTTYERHESFRKADGLAAPAEKSNILFVDGLPNDCTRREVGHLFRPFIGYKDIKVVHKEPRRSGDKAMVFCFVEFDDSKCALTAMEALQGYKFDDKKPDSPVLRIHFAEFPFHLPSAASESEHPRIHQ